MKAIDVWVVVAFVLLCVVLLEVICLFLLARGTSGLSANSFQMQASIQTTAVNRKAIKIFWMFLFFSS